MKEKILIIEDDQEIQKLISANLQLQDFESECVSNGQRGLTMALKKEYALIILDLELPGLDGREVCQRIRDKDQTTPILMLTARSEELDRVLGLEAGADDYLCKPFGMAELLARVRALLRRTRTQTSSQEAAGEDVVAEDTNTATVLEFGELIIDLDKRKATLKGENLDLSKIEFDLIVLLAASPGKVFSRETILKTVWGYSFDNYEHNVNPHIVRLRRKLGDDPDEPTYVKTVWGVGYRFAEREELALPEPE